MTKLDQLESELKLNLEDRAATLSTLKDHKATLIKWEDRLVELKEIELKLVEQIKQEKRKYEF